MPASIEDFSEISPKYWSLLSTLFMQGIPFDFDDACMKAFATLKEKWISAPIIYALDWELSFELMCNASDYVVGAVLG